MWLQLLSALRRMVGRHHTLPCICPADVTYLWPRRCRQLKRLELSWPWPYLRANGGRESVFCRPAWTRSLRGDVKPYSLHHEPGAFPWGLPRGLPRGLPKGLPTGFPKECPAAGKSHGPTDLSERMHFHPLTALHTLISIDLASHQPVILENMPAHQWRDDLQI
jgi:hypothetical protein